MKLATKRNGGCGLTELAGRMRDRFTVVKRVGYRRELVMWRVQLVVGGQSVDVAECSDERTAEWYRDRVALMLSKVVESEK